MSQFDIAEVRWSLGMGITEGDLNDAQRFARCLLLDGIEAAAAQRDLTTSTFGLYGLDLRVKDGKACVPLVTGSNRQITNGAGMVYQWKGNDGLSGLAGGSPRFIPYYVAADELISTLSVGNAVNPRIDRICVKLDLVDGDNAFRDFESFSLGPIVGGVQTYLRTVTSQQANRKRVVQLSSQIIAGTPAASPIPPALPAGWALWCDVLVPQNHNAVFVAKDHLRDWRMPSRQVSCFVPPSAHNVDSSASWTMSGTGSASFLKSTAVGYAQALCGTPGASGRSRLIGVHWKADMTGGVVALNRLDRGGVGDVLTSLLSLGLATNLQELSFPDGMSPVMPTWDTGLPVSVDSLPSATDRDRYQLAVVYTASAANKTVNFTRFQLMSPG